MQTEDRRIFDSHAHVISGDQQRFPSPNASDPQVSAKLADPFTADKLLQEMDESGVGKALLVQRTQVYGFDNRYVIAAAQVSDGRLKAVCGIDATDPDCGKQVRELQRQGAAGMRLMAPIGKPGYDWLDGPAADFFWQEALDGGLPVCLHFFGWNRNEGLARLMKLLDRYPVSNLVVDHLTNGPIVDANACGIDEALRRLSHYSMVSLKFTAIPLNDLANRSIDAALVLQAYIALFGAERLLWGSDVTQSQGDYASLVASGRSAVMPMSDLEAEQLLRRNAERIYRF